jgi:hypothetical protein
MTLKTSHTRWNVSPMLGWFLSIPLSISSMQAATAASHNPAISASLIRDLEKIPQPSELNRVLGRQNRAD